MPTKRSTAFHRKKNASQTALSEAWLEAFYPEVGREVTLARTTQREVHNWPVTLTVGTLAAVWALGGTPFTYPSERSFIVVLVMVPLVLRFFVRACLEYQIFHRWVYLRDALNAYFFLRDRAASEKARAMEALSEGIRLYYFQWRQPRSTWKMLEDNLLLTFSWPVVLLLGLLTWGFIMQPLTPVLRYTVLLVGLWTAFEVYKFYSYFHGRYVPPARKVNLAAL